MGRLAPALLGHTYCEQVDPNLTTLQDNAASNAMAIEG